MIRHLRGDYRYLSNFSKCQIEYEGLTYPSVENAYQALKCLHEDDREQFTTISPAQAKRLGREVEITPSWDDEKVGCMERLLAIKFDHPFYRKKLIQTGFKLIEEGNDWGDAFWGICDGRGLNTLGILLMQLRTKIRKDFRARRVLDEPRDLVVFGDINDILESAEYAQPLLASAQRRGYRIKSRVDSGDELIKSSDPVFYFWSDPHESTVEALRDIYNKGVEVLIYFVHHNFVVSIKEAEDFDSLMRYKQADQDF